MNLKLPIALIDEFTDGEVRSRGELDLASGDIRVIEYEDYDAAAEGPPAWRDDYEFTVGVLRAGDREVEFGVRVDKTTGQYSVTPDELLELKGRAAKLFSQPPGKGPVH
jgi:hypothetical protein